MSPGFRTLIFTILVPGFWTLVMPYWLLMAAGIALYVRCAFWGLRVARPRDAAALGSPEETGCGGAPGLAGRGGHLSIVSALRVGCRIRRGCECVCAALRGARAQTEIRRGI